MSGSAITLSFRFRGCDGRIGAGCGGVAVNTAGTQRFGCRWRHLRLMSGLTPREQLLLGKAYHRTTALTVAPTS
jgi:hypothetical protein